MKLFSHLAVAVLCGLLSAGCSGQVGRTSCVRYDAAPLTRTNGFSTVVDDASLSWVDSHPEYIELSLTMVGPLGRPVTLVQTTGGNEVERWELRPSSTNQVLRVCTISETQPYVGCGASFKAVPHMPQGHYYLLPNDNTVLEAGLAFYLCE